jgi:hypothetical protein
VKIGQTINSLTISKTRFDIRRTPEGVIEVWGEDDISLAALRVPQGIPSSLPF